MARLLSALSTLRLALNSPSPAMLTPASLSCLSPLSRGRGFLLLQACRGAVTQGRTITGAAAGVVQGEKRMRSFQDLPGPSLLTNMYWVFLRGYLLYSHELQFIFKKKYGPIWKTSLGHYKIVHIGDVDLLESVLRQEGKYPVRSDMELWKVHRRLRDYANGPFTEEGQRWRSLRSVLNKKMLRPAEVVHYAETTNEVVTDFLAQLDEMRKDSPSGDMVNNVANALYRYSFEGISHILFETRIGCLERQIPAETQEFIDSIGSMLKNSVYVHILPQWTNNILPYWKRYIGSWDKIFYFGKKLVDQKMEKIQERLDKGEEVQGEYLTYLLSNGQLTDKEVYGSVVELLLAGIDTTSNTLSWALYELSRNLDIQDALYEEVERVAPGDAIPTAEDISKMPLLKAVIKETLRMYPAVPTNSRIVVEKPIIIGDYSFPKDTLFALSHYLISREEANFPEPNKFIPQRWFREQRVKNNPYSSIPFGHGVRACAGRRIAELEMHLLIARLMKKYLLKPEPQGGEIKIVARLVLTPHKLINLRFVERKPLSPRSV
ncbi:sterol 26-hydroxylase, mitochondrial-like [Spea bombifrons]|uniref:sterol 26-hydroxylase, mitochondrial-like n=1 Tax=Spea bombifrons TaxID=233779 RepID=UPI00234B1E0A|nr:sterol 26-hydroxylase, mitochondrial-like [Spea bombifrons]